MRITRFGLLIVSFALVVAACGDSADTTTTAAATDDASAQTTEASETTTTAAAETTTTAAPETTTTVAETTTTAADTTTTAAVVTEGEANERTTAKVEAALAAVPEGWITEITEGFEVESGTDDVFSVCTDDDDFDLVELDSRTVAVSTLMADIPPPEGGFLPGGNASIEARVFESEAVAEEAFAILETVFGTEEGRQCVAEEFLAEMTSELPTDEGEVSFSIDEISVEGAAVAVAINMGMEVEGFSFDFVVELAANRDGDCTVYATFLAFGDSFDPAARDALFSAAAAA